MTSSPESGECDQRTEEEQTSNSVLKTRDGEFDLIVQSTSEDTDDAREEDVSDQERLVTNRILQCQRLTSRLRDSMTYRRRFFHSRPLRTSTCVRKVVAQ